MRELLAIAAATADVPYPASSDAMGAYRRIMADRLGSLRAILGKLSMAAVQPREARSVRGTPCRR